MSSTLENNKAIVRRFNEECLVKVNMEALDEIVRDDFTNHTAPPGFSRDKDSLKTFIQYAFPNIGNISLTIHDMIAEGNKVVTYKTFTGILKAPLLGANKIGEPMELTIIDIIEIKEGRYFGHWSVRQMVQQ
ncbi:ester cyclase [Chitinophaga sp. Cy-1792]|uniref:ester cyclase n=1 Tax=Chitinophaga sp. Cy-1792 TaxID=2608339 RepID=UPI0014243823|nr:ester cyclase [Chitinophaga sp. Cy-1792]NIG53304.1 ester cyclase [Chitinophaga sp. Cy-1792]